MDCSVEVGEKWPLIYLGFFCVVLGDGGQKVHIFIGLRDDDGTKTLCSGRFCYSLSLAAGCCSHFFFAAIFFAATFLAATFLAGAFLADVLRPVITVPALVRTSGLGCGGMVTPKAGGRQEFQLKSLSNICCSYHAAFLCSSGSKPSFLASSKTISTIEPSSA